MNNLLLKENTLSNPHYPVLLSEIIENLQPEDSKKYLDCTFGAGGYTQAILNRANCFVKAIDQDPTVYKYVKKLAIKYKERFEFVQGNFANIKELSRGEQYDGVVVDLGVSSMQLDEKERGFSFMRDGNLDMRMSCSGYSAVDFIASASEEKIAEVIYKYGKEVQSRQIAKMIVQERQKEPITTTVRLAEIVRKSMHYRKSKIDPATKTFQAIRIYLNKELENLETFLSNLNDILSPEAKILIVSFYSLEDSIVKSFFKTHSLKKVARSKYAPELENYDESKWLKIISKKLILPTAREIRENHRSRSARLRVAQKIGGIKMSLYQVISYIAIILCLLTIYCLFTIKDSVVTLRLELEEVKKQVRNEEDAIRILKAELAYLGSPERIQKLAQKYLTLEKTKVTQITKDPLLEEKLGQSKILASAKTFSKPNKWRYKKGPAKYLTMVKN